MTYAECADFPPIEAPPLIEQPKPAAVAVVEPAAALVPISIKAAVLAQFKEAEATVLALVEKYRAVVFNVSTTKGMAEAKAARAELREKGRYALTRAEATVKADVNDLKKVMAEEVARIVGLVLPAEKAIDDQIKAEEDRKAAAKAKEAERVAAHQAGIAKIRAYLAHCQKPDMTAERIATGIKVLEATTFGPEWQEFAEPAKAAQTETLTAMRALHTQTLEREAAAAQAEADRIAREAEQQRQAAENARLAAELAEQKAALDAQAAELAAREKAAADEAARIECLKCDVAAIHARAAKYEDGEHHSWDIFEAIVALEQVDVSEAAFQEFAPMAADAKRLVLAALLKAKDEAEARESVVVVEPQRRGGGRPVAVAAPVPVKSDFTPEADATDRGVSVITSPSVGSMGARATADAAPSVAPAPEVRAFHPAAAALREQPTMTLGQISTRLGFTVTADFLAGLGFEAHKEKASRLYPPSWFPSICTVISVHVLLLGSEAKRRPDHEPPPAPASPGPALATSPRTAAHRLAGPCSRPPEAGAAGEPHPLRERTT